MKRLITALLALAALATITATALAANGNTVWLCNGAQVKTSSERCLVTGSPITFGKLYDLGASAAIECSTAAATGEGWVGPGSEGEVTRVTVSSPETNCKPAAKALNTKLEEVANACSESKSVSALDLAWSVLVYLSGSVALALLRPTTNGEPGYLVECKVAGLTVKDECKSEAGKEASGELENLLGTATELPLVDGKALPIATAKTNGELAKCSVGGAQSGAIEGEGLAEAVSATGVQLSLEISEE